MLTAALVDENWELAFVVVVVAVVVQHQALIRTIARCYLHLQNDYYFHLSLLLLHLLAMKLTWILQR
ncbi:hypothetical protein BJV82DRAFT_623540 [Fennellomyces sp. T-0311]|nr:hypothetical protein BJV82DRAFT_623540 [Fennellomyces sp. T-0311]